MNREDIEIISSQSLALKTVFVAGPFFKLVNPSTNSMISSDKERFEFLIGYFEKIGCKVYNAHKREQWGQAFLEPEDFTKLDYDEILASDLIVAIPGPPASLGTHIELGWASAVGKPILLLLEEGEDYALMLYGLKDITAVAIVKTVSGKFELEDFEHALMKLCIKS